MNINGDTIMILTGVFGLILTILAYIFIVPEKKREKLNNFGKFLHDTVNFKYLIVEKILQFLYILCTAAVLVFGFFALFAVEEHYSYSYYYSSSSSSEWVGYYGLLIMVLGPIAVRLVYEFALMMLLLVKNVIQINSKLKAHDGAVKDDPFAAPDESAYTAPAAPAHNAAAEPEYTQSRTCPVCGAKITVGSFCPSCGAKAD